ncbi:MAG: septation protein SepH [Bifidobacteriaceae bacterium]|nr:septation protein SepH [Bifidobacteriaceae bacterium]
MAEDSLQRASFVRTDEEGLLEFRVDDGRLICVEVTDELERGIIESKQIIAELKGTPSPHSEKALPISTIQTLLRAGEDPQEVAKEYNIGEPLVRRFAKPVEIEKRYQIDQFRHSHMPGSQIAHETVESALQSQLLQSGVRFTDVTWDATRHGRDPWRISASFPQSGRTYTAEWSFDTLHGTITCLDQVSKRLFGLTTASAADAAGMTGAVDANGADGAAGANNAARQVAVQGADGTASHHGDAQAASTSGQSLPSAQEAQAAQSALRRGGRVAAADSAPDAAQEFPTTDDAQQGGAGSTAGNSAATSSARSDDDAQTERIPAESVAAEVQARSNQAMQAAPTQPAQPAHAAPAEQPQKKSRPVFRKWDDIIFGE